MRQWGLLLAVGGALVAGATVGGAPAAPVVAPTFTLDTTPTCDKTKGEEPLGRSCVNPIRTLHDKWTFGDGKATWDVPGQWVSTYEWTIPATVPAAGANLTMKLSATERIGGPNNRICPAMGAVSGFGLQGAQPQTIGFCAEAGGTKSETKTLKMVASSAQPAGSTLYLSIGLQDGPHYTYTYTSEKRKACRRFSSTTAALECSHPVSFTALYGGRPKGTPARVLDVRIAAQGAGKAEEEYTDEGDATGDLKLNLNWSRVVLERDYFTNNGDRETQRLVLARPEDEDLDGEPPGARSIQTKLVLVASNDPACVEPAGKKTRTALLVVSDRGDGKKRKEDVIALVVKGCEHHEYLVKGVNRVKVAISVK